MMFAYIVAIQVYKSACDLLFYSNVKRFLSRYSRKLKMQNRVFVFYCYYYLLSPVVFGFYYYYLLDNVRFYT